MIFENEKQICKNLNTAQSVTNKCNVLQSRVKQIQMMHGDNKRQEILTTYG